MSLEELQERPQPWPTPLLPSVRDPEPPGSADLWVSGSKELRDNDYLFSATKFHGNLLCSNRDQIQQLFVEYLVGSRYSSLNLTLLIHLVFTMPLLGSAIIVPIFG